MAFGYIQALIVDHKIRLRKQQRNSNARDFEKRQSTEISCGLEPDTQRCIQFSCIYRKRIAPKMFYFARLYEFVSFLHMNKWCLFIGFNAIKLDTVGFVVVVVFVLFF